MNDNPFLTAAEAADYLACDVQTLAKWRSLSKGPAYIKAGYGFVRYPKSDLDNWIEKHHVEPKGWKP